MIKGKDVLLMIGNTGSGKSTNILKFLGYDLVPGNFGKLSTLVLTSEPE
jgi:HrpA-like RNA helicase